MTEIDKFTSTFPLSVKRTALQKAVIHFAGDSGDGMQLAGMQFTQSCAAMGNDVRTFPDYPAEIRAPQGTLPGVSGFQLSFSQVNIHTPGDKYDVLVAMNPAALKVSIKNLNKGGILIIDEDKFIAKDLKKLNYPENLADISEFSQYRIVRLPMTSLTLRALESFEISRPQARKCKNMFALGVVYWLYHRPLEETKEWIKERFKEEPNIQNANIAALRAGYHYAITTELFAEHYTVEAATLPPGEYRQMTGNQALAWGCITAAKKAKQTLLVSGYPITPASDILHILAKYSHFDVITFQAEDEIAAIGAAIGASFGGKLAITSTSGPGMDLKSEALGLAVMAELPLVIVDVQRAGPSTGMPTKVEQSDLLTAIFGRHGECPVPVIAACTPSDCFKMVFEAFRVATKYMTPVILLSDATLANSAEPWKIPLEEELPEISIEYQTKSDLKFLPYLRDPKTLSRPWALPGTAGLEHRIGGLEKEDETGNISYDPENHHKMVNLRANKVKGIEFEIPSFEIVGDPSGKVLVVGWGSTYGAIRTAVEELRETGKKISALNLRVLNPLPQILSQIFKHFEHILVVELNLGQLKSLLRSHFLVDAKGINKIEGRPFAVSELKEHLLPYWEK